MPRSTFLIALGSNRRHGCHGAPPRILAAALETMAEHGLEVRTVSPVFSSAPLGPASRRYANAAALIETALDPAALLMQLKAIERTFGRRPGRRWGPRVLDLDIVLWSGGIWASPGLAIPHPGFRTRGFVLDPAAAIAPGWRDPVTAFTLRQLAARLARKARLTAPARMPR